MQQRPRTAGSGMLRNPSIRPPNVVLPALETLGHSRPRLTAPVPLQPAVRPPRAHTTCAPCLTFRAAPIFLFPSCGLPVCFVHPQAIVARVPVNPGTHTWQSRPFTALPAPAPSQILDAWVLRRGCNQGLLPSCPQRPCWLSLAGQCSWRHQAPPPPSLPCCPVAWEAAHTPPVRCPYTCVPDNTHAGSSAAVWADWQGPCPQGTIGRKLLASADAEPLRQLLTDCLSASTLGIGMCGWGKTQPTKPLWGRTAQKSKYSLSSPICSHHPTHSDRRGLSLNRALETTAFVTPNSRVPAETSPHILHSIAFNRVPTLRALGTHPPHRRRTERLDTMPCLLLPICARRAQAFVTSPLSVCWL
jgi:hypothetical protein